MSAAIVIGQLDLVVQAFEAWGVHGSATRVSAELFDKLADVPGSVCQRETGDDDEENRITESATVTIRGHAFTAQRTTFLSDIERARIERNGSL